MGPPQNSLWHVICEGRPASTLQASVQVYVGDTVEISAAVHSMLEFGRASVSGPSNHAGGGGIKLPLAQRLSVLGHAIVIIAARGLPQDAIDIHATHARVDALRHAFNAGATVQNDHAMENFVVADRPVHSARLASLVIKDLERLAMDLRTVSDFCDHHWAYPLPVGVFGLIPVPKWPSLSAYVNLGGLLNIDVQQPGLTPTTTTDARDGECRQWARNGECHFGDTCCNTHVTRPHTRGTGAKHREKTNGGSAVGGVTDSSAATAAAPAKRAKVKGKDGAGGGGGGGRGSGCSNGSDSDRGSGSGSGSGGGGASDAGGSTRSAAAKAGE